MSRVSWSPSLGAPTLGRHCWTTTAVNSLKHQRGRSKKTPRCSPRERHEGQGHPPSLLPPLCGGEVSAQAHLGGHVCKEGRAHRQGCVLMPRMRRKVERMSCLRCGAVAYCRSLCRKHYSAAAYAVAHGRTTWKKLEREGKVAKPVKAGRKPSTGAEFA